MAKKKKPSYMSPKPNRWEGDEFIIPSAPQQGRPGGAPPPRNRPPSRPLPPILDNIAGGVDYTGYGNRYQDVADWYSTLSEADKNWIIKKGYDANDDGVVSRGEAFNFHYDKHGKGEGRTLGDQAQQAGGGFNPSPVVPPLPQQPGGAQNPLLGGGVPSIGGDVGSLFGLDQPVADHYARQRQQLLDDRARRQPQPAPIQQSFASISAGGGAAPALTPVSPMQNPVAAAQPPAPGAPLPSGSPAIDAEAIRRNLANQQISMPGLSGPDAMFNMNLF